MISALASDIYTANAAAIGQVTPGYKVQPVPAVESHERGTHGVHDDAVKVSVSDEAKNLLALMESEQIPVEKTPDRSPNDYTKLLKKKRAEHPLAEEGKTDELSDEDKEQVRKLEERDREVKLHEQQHAAVGGAYVQGGPTYEYQTGPDGQKYAVGGHVDIDVSEGSTPEETIRKAQVIQAAATAPSEPSSADLKVAAQASAMLTKAMAQVSEKQSKPESNKADKEDDKETEAVGKSEEDTPAVRSSRVTKALRAYNKTMKRAS